MSFFRNRSTGTKIISIVIIMTLFLCVVGFMGYTYLNETSVALDEMYHGNLLPIDWLNEVRQHTRANEANIYKIILTESPGKRAIYEADIEDRTKSANEMLANFDKIKMDDKVKKMYEQSKANLTTYREARSTILDMVNSGRMDEAINYIGTFENALEGFTKSVDEITEYMTSRTKAVNDQNDQESARVQFLLIVIIVSAVALGLFIGWLISRMITAPLKIGVSKLQQLSEGDLTVEPTKYLGKDEVGRLGEALNRLISNLHGLIRQVQETGELVASSSEELNASAEQTKSATEQITNAIQEVAEASDKQLTGIEESVRVVNEMAQGVQRIAETTGVVASASVASANEARAGNDSLKRVINQMDVINKSVNQSAEIVKQLGARSQEIGKIVEVISGIASQTNLLALNAAIEAARAGEHGRGFSIVADEVRKLAEQSDQSAQQIAALIQEIQKDTDTAIESMNHGITEVERGAEVVRVTGEAFVHIVHSAESIAGQIQEVSAATEEISASSEQIAASMEAMNHLSQESVGHIQGVAASSEEQYAAMEEVATSSESLSNLANDLKLAIGRFKV